MRKLSYAVLALLLCFLALTTLPDCVFHSHKAHAAASKVFYSYEYEEDDDAFLAPAADILEYEYAEEIISITPAAFNLESDGVTNLSFDQFSYFYNLADYSSTNEIGTCTYVALIELLSYYDTFYNDDIIPDVYDRCSYSFKSYSEVTSVANKSPGVIREKASEAGFSKDDYESYVYATYSFKQTDEDRK